MLCCVVFLGQPLNQLCCREADYSHLVDVSTFCANMHGQGSTAAVQRGCSLHTQPWLSKDKSITGNDIMSPVCPGDRSKNISQEERRATVPEPIVPKSFGCFRRTDMDTDSGMCSTQLPPIQ